MKKLFAVAVLLTISAGAFGAQSPKGKGGATAPTTQASPGDGKGRGDTSEQPHHSAAVNDGGRRPEDGIPSVPHPTPPSGVTTTPDDETGRAQPIPGTDASGGSLEASKAAPEHVAGFRWLAAAEQTMRFLAVQHAYALTQPKTRRDLHGSFFRDYFRSVRSLHGWADGGRFFTNYVAHPMEGSLLGFIQVQNDPAGSRLRFGGQGRYWRSRMKALAWSAVWSTQFEIGPISQASIGNVGLHGKQTYVDIVMTPTAGLGLLLAEDALDRYVIERLERRTQNRYVRIFSRMALNPTRTASNLLRFKKPWYRDAGLR